MTHPDRLSDWRTSCDPRTAQVVTGLAGSWMRAVAGANFVPGGQARARAALEDLLYRLIAALRAEPFDPSRGHRVGIDLVATHVSSPAALGETIALLSQNLPTAVGTTGDTQARLAMLLGHLATGFTEALRDAALQAAEGINRAERAVWRRKQHTLQRRLQHALLHDPMTGLPNRSRLLGRLAEQLADPTTPRLALCLLNLDRFQAVNDSLGHDTGDRLLRAVARQLRPWATGHGHFLAHLGADEFALVVPDTCSPDDAVKAVEQVLDLLPDPFTVDGHRIPVTAKVGIIERAAAGTDPTELLRAAAIALGWAKTDHGARWAIFDLARSEADIARHRLTAQMPAALDNNEFTLVYQPLTRMDDRTVVGVEALARWDHPTLGVLSPDQFIPLAEQTGLIEPLTWYLLRRACTDAATWRHAAHPPVVSVNLAPALLRRPGLPATVAATLQQTGLPPERLQLEITESATLDAHHPALAALAKLGVRLAIDDFGTGYSSLAYLADLPVLTVKLAGRFLRGLDATGSTHRCATAMLSKLIALCHDLDISVIAEEIETATQARHLTELGCDIGQGFHLGRPTTVHDITAILMP